MYLNSDSDNDDGGIDTFNLESILKAISVRYPDLNFHKYENTLRSLGVVYLDVAAQFPTSWYTDPEKTGMSEGEATLFQEWVTREMVKQEKEKRKRREIHKGKKKVRMSSPENDENASPVALSSRD